MWSAIYKNIDKSGLQPELKVTIEFSNDQDSTTYVSEYQILPSELDMSFPGIIQSQIDILNAKDIPQADLDKRIDTTISVIPIMEPPIQVIN